MIAWDTSDFGFRMSRTLLFYAYFYQDLIHVYVISIYIKRNNDYDAIQFKLLNGLRLFGILEVSESPSKITNSIKTTFAYTCFVSTSMH